MTQLIGALKYGPNQASFCLFSSSSQIQRQILFKCDGWCGLDGVFVIWAQGKETIGAAESTELGMASPQPFTCTYIFLIYWPSPASFCLFSSFSHHNDKYGTINYKWKSADRMLVYLGFEPMDGADESTELWWPTQHTYKFFITYYSPTGRKLIKFGKWCWMQSFSMISFAANSWADPRVSIIVIVPLVIIFVFHNSPENV